MRKYRAQLYKLRRGYFRYHQNVTFATLTSVQVGDRLRRSRLLQGSEARSCALQLCRLKRHYCSKSRLVVSCETLPFDSIALVSWHDLKAPPPLTRRFFIMPPQSSLRKDRAVNLVLSDAFDARGAAEKVGLGPEAVQGIRKRVRSIRATEAKERAEEEHLRIVRTSPLRAF